MAITKPQEEKVYEEKLYYDLHDLCASLFVQFKRIKQYVKAGE